MTKSSTPLPSTDCLQAVLHGILTRGQPDVNVRVLRRCSNPNSSTYPSEIVTCQIDSRPEIQLHCKYSGNDDTDLAYGHRGGLGYECYVYANVLNRFELTLPSYYGSFFDSERQIQWMIVEHLANCHRVENSPLPNGLAIAAKWLASFHAQTESCLGDSRLAGMISHDKEYYQGWAERALEFVSRSRRDLSWLQLLCVRYKQRIAELCDLQTTVVHGEFTPNNILIKEQRAFPIDWESAAMGLAETDLAMLTDGWITEQVEQSERIYKECRWGDHVPASFRPALELSKVYVHLRWLGDWPQSIDSPKNVRRINRLRECGERAGLI